MATTPTLTIHTAVDLGGQAQFNAFAEQIAANTKRMADAFEQMGNKARQAGHAMHEAGNEGAAAFRLAGEEVGVKMNRHIANFLAKLPGVGAAMNAAFSAFAIVGVLEVVGQVIEKITELSQAAEKNRVAWEHIEFASRDATDKINKEIESQEAKYIELTQGPIAKLEFELGHMRSIAVEAFKEIGAQMDATSKQLTEESGNWFVSFFAGTGGKKEIGEEIKRIQVEMEEAMRSAQSSQGQLLVPEHGKALTAAQEEHNINVLNAGLINQQLVLKQRIVEAQNKLKEYEGLSGFAVEHNVDALTRQIKLYQDINNQLELRKKQQAETVKTQSQEEKTEIHKVSTGEGDERISADKRLADAQIKLAEEMAVAKAKAIASGEKLAALESGASRTKDLDEQAIYAAQIFDLTTKSATAVRDAQISAANQRRDAEVKADRELIALHNSNSEEDKKARQKAADDIRLAEINNQSEILKINEEYDTRIVATKQKSAQAQAKIAEEQRVRTITIQEETVKAQEIALAGQMKAVSDSYSRQAKDIEESFKLHKVTYRQELAELQDTYKQEEAAAVALLEKKRALYIQEAQLAAAKNGEILTDEQIKLLPGMQEIDNQILAAHGQFLNKKQALDAQALQREQQQAQTLTNSLKSAYDTMVLNATSFHDAVTKLWEKVGQKVTDVAFKMVGDWITAIGQGEDFSALSALKQITQSAYQAAANTYAAVSGTPIIGPVLAPVAAAAAFVAVEAFGAGVGSAEQGAVLPNDMFILAHQNEMILPAPISKAVQGLAKSSTEIGSGGNGGSAVHVHLNVQALDSTGVHQVLQNNLSAIGKAVTDAHKAGHISQHALAR